MIRFIVAALLSAPIAAQAQNIVRVGWCARTVSSAAAPFAVAQKLGWFPGFTVSLVPMPGSTDCVKNVATKEVPYAVASIEPLAIIRPQGVKALNYYTAYQGNIYGLAVPEDSPVHAIADLKGKRIGVTTAGSLTDWLVRELSRQQGWGSNGIGIAALGQMQARLAAMDRGELDGMVIEAATGYELEENGRSRNLILFGDIVKHFYTHVIYATDDMIEKRPELLRRFLRGWFKTVAFMRANRDFTVKSEQRTLDVRQSIVEKIYDAQMAGFSADGAWDPEAIEVIRQSLKELGILPTVPDAKVLYNDKFVPVRF